MRPLHPPTRESRVPVPAGTAVGNGRAAAPPIGTALPASILWMVGATALWALAFIVPVIIPDASALDITIGRFLIYGIGSMLALTRVRLSKFSPRDWLLAASFALFGNVLYYLVLVLGIQKAGAGLAVPIIGLLPVTVSLFGQMRGREVPVRRLSGPLTAVLVGILMVNLSRANTLDGGTRPTVVGMACLLLPVVMWTWYAIANAAFLKRRPDVSGGEWASVVGAMSLTLALLLLAGEGISVVAGHTRLHMTDTRQWLTFWACSLALGAGASWGGSALFNKASATLPVALTGQLIVFETFFGVAYVFLAGGRVPRPVEIAGFIVAIAGIWLSIRVLHPSRSRHRETAT